ncbi:integral membrane sensor hybrid histidine kinase : Integral membrane sensor hybrid histidine kinase OS=Planctomyces brasiliensis (strain ATCC 49424 / DSM 5305 / JCM 21570 / NBRC 103401 / IFAM 1448) GN=Plabr_0357 PE=4 SV=1: Response_reg [Gemmata massiliana]|uniref:Response regulatory domain-containing protein n=1 Tax=Gemmata massiliana TaxID=1210884 RepID=A0A6P2CYX3_9BACT|nr:response regulator [Gemmata massiliana]VTR93586.1 integral membrane sensor hybrid histidine kinase : Integral membrane sensor hybrid histidine kinase OS=Planctomyces brasiliensis (strain ATCC 49424 / DSM 5305 / JCM 21570 / NBRC 103401 / IFAM 1448) GN=Plabr_0357 PE=4 SV=1: Response_reg [Gemmata massiliana]
MPHTEKPLPPLRVLVVDDDPDTATSQFDLLTLCGFVVKAVTDGDTALRVVHEFRPDVILTDLMMPGISGIELARRITATGVSPPPFLVAVTGCYGDDLRASEGSGFDLVLIKPVDPEVLISTLRRIAANRK